MLVMDGWSAVGGWDESKLANIGRPHGEGNNETICTHFK